MFSKNKWVLANRNLLVAVSLSILTIASCGGGGSGSSSPNEKPVSVSLTATPSIVGPGETTTLNWVSTNAKSCELTNQAGVKVASGLSDAYTTTLPLDSAAAFTITCTGVTAGDTVSQTKTFAKVSAKPTITLSASPPSVVSGAKTIISWSSSNSTSCKFTDGSVYGAPDTYVILLTSGSFITTALTGPATFRMQCDGPGGNTTTPPFPVGIDTCSTTGATGDILLSSVAASRTNGVAPLSVFFDATSATAPAKTTRPFHELEYRWDFGDATSGVPNLSPPVTTTNPAAIGVSTWNTGSKPGVSSRNNATGPVAAHVYETPGTYKVNLTVTDGTNTVTNKCTQITIHDPDVIFAGASLTGPNTICIGSTSTPTPGANGCPADALGVQQADFATAINSYAKTGKRVLFKRGDSFTSISNASISNPGPGIIGAYGAGPRPIVNSTAAHTLKTTIASPSDWRVMDFELNGLSTPNNILFLTQGDVEKLTLLRVYAHDGGLGFNIGGSEIFIVDSQINNIGSSAFGATYSVYAQIYKSAILGSDIQFRGNLSGNVGHTARFPFMAKGIISNSHIGEAGQNAGSGFIAIKLHGPTWCNTNAGNTCDYTTDTCGTFNGGNGACNSYPTPFSEQDIISDNELTGPIKPGPYILALGPQNATSDERIQNIIIERNIFKTGTAGGSQTELNIGGQEITVRNNIFDMTGGSMYRSAITAIQSATTSPPAANIRIYNNTMYSPDVSSDFYGISTHSTTTNLSIYNNLIYAPFASTYGLIKGSTGLGTTDFNNSSPTQIHSALPNFTATPPNSITDWKPICTGLSYPCGQGIIVEVWSDFFLTNQPNPRDIGAINH